MSIKTNEGLFLENSANLSKPSLNQYQISRKLILDKNMTNINNYNNNSDNTRLIYNKKINSKPQKNIRIINIISPINRTETYNNNKNNIFSSKVNIYRHAEKNNFNYIIKSNNFIKNNKSLIINNYCNKLLSYNDNNNDGLLLDESKKICNEKYISPLRIKNPFKTNQKEIMKANSCFGNKKITSNSVIFMNIKSLNKKPKGSFLYNSPKSIEKFKQ